MVQNNNNNNLEIYQRYSEIIYYTYNLLKKYPKSENFALVQEIKSNMLSGLKNLMYAVKSYKSIDKLKYLNEFDITLSLFKFYIRLSYNYKYISMQNYKTWSNMLTNICNMLGGWINSCHKK